MNTLANVKLQQYYITLDDRIIENSLGVLRE